MIGQPLCNATNSRAADTTRREPIALDDILIGKDVLELVSSAMYVDPMTVYREYIQNSADAIDEARRKSILHAADAGRVEISIDPDARSVRIRDNGIGVPSRNFVRRLTALGASAKRGTAARGFRGVGRLAGLGYAQFLVFRTRVSGERAVSEMTWDCRRLRSALRATESDPGIAQLIHNIVSVSKIDGDTYPERFFEVEMRGVVRLRNDKLMSAAAIADYLAQVAPVPFSPQFPFSSKIEKALTGHVSLGNLQLTISGIESCIFRPHKDGFADEDQFVPFEDIEIVEIPNIDGGLAAIAWVAHHAYEGAVPSASLLKGLRIRCGNIQVGEQALLEELFQEPRFNGWSIGEIHVVDPMIIPNGRRDNFEQNAHYTNLLNHLTPTARSIGRRCRANSRRRQKIRDFEAQATSARERLAIVEQGGLSASARSAQLAVVDSNLARMSKMIEGADFFSDSSRLSKQLETLQAHCKALKTGHAQVPLAHLPPKQRKTYEHFFGMIYECSANRVAAKALIDRLIEKIIETSTHPAAPKPACRPSKTSRQSKRKSR